MVIDYINSDSGGLLIYREIFKGGGKLEVNLSNIRYYPTEKVYSTYYELDSSNTLSFFCRFGNSIL